MATITKKQMEEYERLRRDRDNGRVLTPDGLRIICAAYENDPEKIGIHMLEMLAKAEVSVTTRPRLFAKLLN